MVQKMYGIVLKRYRTIKDMESGNPYSKNYYKEFEPMTFKECQTVIPKLIKQQNSIHAIVPYEEVKNS